MNENTLYHIQRCLIHLCRHFASLKFTCAKIWRYFIFLVEYPVSQIGHKNYKVKTSSDLWLNCKYEFIQSNISYTIYGPIHVFSPTYSIMFITNSSRLYHENKYPLSTPLCLDCVLSRECYFSVDACCKIHFSVNYRIRKVICSVF